MPTPHISANQGDFAETVLLPGDPLRAKHIAETYFDDVEQITAVRNMFGFTGTYKGTRISTMGTGMGVPSASIYVTELINEFGVSNLIRVGTCGGVNREVGMQEVILAVGASTDSGVNRTRFDGLDFAATADWQLLHTAVEAAGSLEMEVRVGNVFTADLFYTPDPSRFELLERMGILAVEMEAAGIYGAAVEHGARALAICTVSDHIITGESTTSDERQSSFAAMMEIALETAVAL